MIRLVVFVGSAIAVVVVAQTMPWLVPGVLLGVVLGYFLGQTRTEWRHFWHDTKRAWRNSTAGRTDD